MKIINKSAQIKAVTLFLCMLLTVIAPSLTITANAETVKGNVESYRPIHMAVVMDASGSIKSSSGDSSSDPDLLSREAAKIMVDCLPSEKNKVALFEYSNTFTKVTDLTSLDSADNVKMLENKLSGMTECKGDTHMIDAIQSSREFLDKNSEDGVQNVIVVFTDGAENGVITPQNATTDKIKKAVGDALGNSDVIVYSVAFDYEDSEGNHSIIGDSEKGGYGKEILDEFSNRTGGQVLITENDITGLDESFTKIIADLCHIQPVQIDEFEGNGDTHVTEVDISNSVIEADLRISCNTPESIKKGDIKLITPNGEEIPLSTDGSKDRENIWYSVDKLAANIKIITPDVGKWKVEVSNIVSEKPIKISLIEQYNMSLEVVLNSGNEDFEDLPAGEKLDVEVFLVSDGKRVEESTLYDMDSIEAFAYVSSDMGKLVNFNKLKNEDIDSIADKLANREGTETIKLESTGKSFKGEVPLNNSGAYLLSIWINSGRFYCYEDRVISVNGEIVKINDPNDITLYNGESATIENILGYCSSDKATAELEPVNSEAAKAVLENNTLNVLAIAPGETTANIKYTSVDGSSSFTIPFKIKVLNSPPQIESDKNIEEIKIRKDAEMDINNILNGVTDYENDPLTLSILEVLDSDIVEAEVSGDTVHLKGLEEGKTEIQFLISDGTSDTNVVMKVVHVTVNESVKSLCIKWSSLVLGVIVLIILTALLLHKKRRLRTQIRNVTITRVSGEYGENNTSYEVLTVRELKEVNYRKRNQITLKDLMKNALEYAEVFIQDEEIRTFVDNSKELTKIKIVGGLNRRKPDVIKGSSDIIGVSRDPFDKRLGKKINRSISNNANLDKVTIYIGKEIDPIQLVFEFEYGR